MLSQLILRLAQQAGTVTTRTQRIDDLGEFLLDNIPYGKISPTDLLPGFVEYDGPAQQPVSTPKKALVWHFGGEPFAITKAVRIRYTYRAYYEGGEKQLTGSLFIGFQVPAAAPPPPPDLGVVPGHMQDVIDQLKVIGNYDVVMHPSTVLTVAQVIGDIGAFIQAASPYGAIPWLAPGAPGANAIIGSPMDVEYDGPAQTYDSGDAFPFSQTTLFQNRDKYDELLWWYFGGKPYGITKAIKVTYKRVGISPDEAVFFGYQGPGNYP